MIWDFILYSIPWWAKLAVALAVAAVILLAVGNAVGWGRLRPWLAPIVAVLAALALLDRSRQQGYADRKVAEKAADDAARKTVEHERTDAHTMTDKQLDDETDRWSR